MLFYGSETLPIKDNGMRRLKFTEMCKAVRERVKVLKSREADLVL